MDFERKSRGRVYGGSVEICAESYLCPKSFASGTADIWKSRLEHSRVGFNSKLRQATIDHSVIGDEGADVEINSSTLGYTRFYGGTALNCKISDSVIKGSPYFRGSGNGVAIGRCLIEGDVVLENDVLVVGIELKGKMRLSKGIWTRPPRYFEFNNEIAEIGITESVDGYASIGCRHKKMTEWMKKKTLWQRAARWSDEMIRVIHLNFEQWLDEPMPTTGINI